MKNQIDLNRPLIQIGVLLVILGSLYLASKDVSDSFIILEEFQKNDVQKISPLSTFYPPCSKQDTSYEIITHGTYGKLCLEKKSVPDSIKSILRMGYTWEGELVPYFEKYINPGNVVIDVGAHIGTHTIIFSHLVGSAGLVYTFEPNFKIYQEQMTNLNINNISNVRSEFIALGANDQRGSMGITVAGNEGHTSLGIGGNIVEIRKLDSYTFKRVDFIKIDVEGAEKGVLMGAKETLKKHRPVLLIEIHRLNEEFENVIGDLGYKLTKIKNTDDYVALPQAQKDE